MSIEVTGIDSTMKSLRRTGDRVYKAQLPYLRRMAEKIRERASEYAPVDEYNLESAIVVSEDKELGGRHRVVLYIGVDPDLLGQGYQKYGFRYDEYVHEMMDSPSGSGTVRRGPKTIAKGPQAGGKYLERAFKDFEDEIRREMAEIARRSAK